MCFHSTDATKLHFDRQNVADDNCWFELYTPVSYTHLQVFEQDAKDYNEYYDNQLTEILSNDKYGNNGHFNEVDVYKRQIQQSSLLREILLNQLRWLQ